MKRSLHRSLPLGVSETIAVLFAGGLAVGQLSAAVVSLDALQQDGYGTAAIRRPRPNVLTVPAEIDGRKVSLMVDSRWPGEGIGLHGGASSKAQRITIGNVQLAQVPLSPVNLDSAREPGAAARDWCGWRNRRRIPARVLRDCRFAKPEALSAATWSGPPRGY